MPAPAVLHLENVLTELHAVTIRDGLAFPNYFRNWDAGQPTDPGAAGYAKTLLDQLAWWGHRTPQGTRHNALPELTEPASQAPWPPCWSALMTICSRSP
jgi:hypothetical protein